MPLKHLALSCYLGLCFNTIQDNMPLKQKLYFSLSLTCFNTIQDNMPLKPHYASVNFGFRFNTIQDNMPLKRSRRICRTKKSFNTIQDNMPLKPQIPKTILQEYGITLSHNRQNPYLFDSFFHALEFDLSMILLIAEH